MGGGAERGAKEGADGGEARSGAPEGGIHGWLVTLPQSMPLHSA